MSTKTKTKTAAKKPERRRELSWEREAREAHQRVVARDRQLLRTLAAVESWATEAATTQRRIDCYLVAGVQALPHLVKMCTARDPERMRLEELERVFSTAFREHFGAP